MESPVSRPAEQSGNFCLEGHIDVPAEHLNAVTAALIEHVRLSRAEPGCVYYSVTADRGVAGRFNISEIFADTAGYDAHEARVAKSAWPEFSRHVTYEGRKWVA